MASTQTKTILLVEDNPDLREATTDLLGTLGYRVLVAAGKAPAVEIARQTPFHLLLVNAYPARGEGIEIVDKVRELVPGAPALLVSGFGDEPRLRQRVLEGNVEFLRIPFSLDRLADKIQETLKARPTDRPAAPEADARHRPKTSSAVLRPKRARSVWRPALAAAIAIVAMGIILRFADTAPQLPAPDLDSALRSSTIELQRPLGQLQTTPTLFVWQGHTGAVLYRVVLETVDSAKLWEIETQSTSVKLPPDLLERLQPAVSYHWRVEGFDEERSRIGASTLETFTLATPEPKGSGHAGIGVKEHIA